MWTPYTVRFDFVSEICGGVPADPKLVDDWVRSRMPKTRPPQSMGIDQIAEEVLSTVPEDVEPSLHIFQRHPKTRELVVEARTIRGHVKDCASILSSLYVGKPEKEKSFAVKCKNSIYYPPALKWIPIHREDGSLIYEADGTRDKPLHVMTPQGPRSALKTLEFLVEGCYIEFPLLILTNTQNRLVVSEKDLGSLFLYGGTHGYGPERSDGQGRYIATVTPGEPATGA